MEVHNSWQQCRQLLLANGTIASNGLNSMPKSWLTTQDRVSLGLQAK
jgi:hypothetical protein